MVRAFVFDWKSFGPNHTCYSPKNSRNLDLSSEGFLRLRHYHKNSEISFVIIII